MPSYIIIIICVSVLVLIIFCSAIFYNYKLKKKYKFLKSKLKMGHITHELYSQINKKFAKNAGVLPLVEGMLNEYFINRIVSSRQLLEILRLANIFFNNKYCSSIHYLLGNILNDNLDIISASHRSLIIELQLINIKFENHIYQNIPNISCVSEFELWSNQLFQNKISTSRLIRTIPEFKSEHLVLFNYYLREAIWCARLQVIIDALQVPEISDNFFLRAFDLDLDKYEKNMTEYFSENKKKFILNLKSSLSADFEKILFFLSSFFTENRTNYPSFLQIIIDESKNYLQQLCLNPLQQIRLQDLNKYNTILNLTDLDSENISNHQKILKISKFFNIVSDQKTLEVKAINILCEVFSQQIIPWLNLETTDFDLINFYNLLKTLPNNIYNKFLCFFDFLNPKSKSYQHIWEIFYQEKLTKGQNLSYLNIFITQYNLWPELNFDLETISAKELLRYLDKLHEKQATENIVDKFQNEIQDFIIDANKKFNVSEFFANYDLEAIQEIAESYSFYFQQTIGEIYAKPS